MTLHNPIPIHDRVILDDGGERVGEGDVAIFRTIPGDEAHLLSRPGREGKGAWKDKVEQTIQARKYVKQARTGRYNSDLLDSKDLMLALNIPDVIQSDEDKKGLYAIVEKIEGKPLDGDLRKIPTSEEVFAVKLSDKAYMCASYLYYLHIMNLNGGIMVDHKASSLFWSDFSRGIKTLSLVDVQIIGKEGDINHSYFHANQTVTPNWCWDTTVGKIGNNHIENLKGIKTTLEAIALGGPRSGDILPKLDVPWEAGIPIGIQNVISKIETYESAETAAADIMAYLKGKRSTLEATSSQKITVIDVLGKINQYNWDLYKDSFGEIHKQMIKVYDCIKDNHDTSSLDSNMNQLFYLLLHAKSLSDRAKGNHIAVKSLLKEK